MSDDENQNLKREEYEQKEGKNPLNEDNNKILITEVNTLNKKKMQPLFRNQIKNRSTKIYKTFFICSNKYLLS